MKRSLTPLYLLSLALGFTLTVGCGDSEPDTVAQAPAASGASSQPASSSGGGDGEEYGGGESYGDEGEGGGESYGDEGGGYGGGGPGSTGGDYGAGEMYGGGPGSTGGDYGGGEGEMYGGGGYGPGREADNGGGSGRRRGPATAGMGGGGGEYGGGGDYGGSYGGPGYSGGGEGGYGGDGGGMYGGAGMSGGGFGQGGPQGAGAPLAFASVNQFLIQNCSQCHMRGQEKGNVTLANMSREVVDGIEMWESVAGVLESGEMPPRGRPQPNPAQKQKVVDWIRTSVSQAAEAKKDLIASSERYFSRGKEAKAVQLLLAHAVSAPEEEAAEILEQVQWFALGKKPALALRFAVGVTLDAPSTLTDVSPIGSQSDGNGGGMSGMSGMSRRGSGGGAPAGRKRSFESLTGEFGGSIAAAFATRWADGKMGTVLNEVEPAKEEAAAANGGMGGYGGGGYGGGGMGMGMDVGAGPGGPGGGYGGGNYGGGSYGGSGYGGEGGGDAFAVDTLETGPTYPGEAVLPGLLYVGEGSLSELKERAADAGVDAVFVFEVEASQNNRTRQVNNSTRCRLVTPGGDVIGSTTTLKNNEVRMARMRGKDDGLEKNVDRIFLQFDKELQLATMPAVSPAAAQKRMAQILGDATVTPLQKMFEARLYHSMNGLTDEELSMVYQIAMEGNEGQSLAQGTEDDRQLVIEMALEKMDVL